MKCHINRKQNMFYKLLKYINKYNLCLIIHLNVHIKHIYFKEIYSCYYK